MATLIMILVVITFMALALTRRKRVNKAIKRREQEIRTIRQRTWRLNHAARRGETINLNPRVRGHREPDDPHDPNRKYEGRRK